jgi:hypothetical protein
LVLHYIPQALVVFFIISFNTTKRNQMADPIVAGAQSAVNTLKAAQGASKQLSSVVMDQQADMEKAVQQQHVQRLKVKAEREYLATLAEFRAYEKYQKEKAHQRKIDELKLEAIKKYGKTAWAEIEATKAKMEKERADELKYMDKDRNKLAQLFWWCMTAAALITYFFKLYKI